MLRRCRFKTNIIGRRDTPLPYPAAPISFRRGKPIARAKPEGSKHNCLWEGVVGVAFSDSNMPGSDSDSDGASDDRSVSPPYELT